MGQLVRWVDSRNKGLQSVNLLGISIDKYFMPSVANVIGTDLSSYKVVSVDQFACNPMHVGRDEKMPVALYMQEDPSIVSPAYFVFEVIDSNEILPEYLMLWFRRKEFDREVWFHTDGSVRGGILWEELCELTVPVPSIAEQQEIVDAYNDIERRIALKRKINDNLAAIMQSTFKSWFVTFEHFRDQEMQDSQIGEIPSGWQVKKLTELMSYAGGQQPPASEFVYEPKEGYIRLVQIRDYETDKYATYIPVSKKNKLCNDHDIMIARYGVSLGRICYGLNGAYNVALAKVSPLKPYYREFLRCFLNTETFYNDINGSGERSAQQGFNQSGMDAFLLPVPPDNILEQFEHLLAPMFEYRLFIRSKLAHLIKTQEAILESLANHS